MVTLYHVTRLGASSSASAGRGRRAAARVRPAARAARRPAARASAARRGRRLVRQIPAAGAVFLLVVRPRETGGAAARRSPSGVADVERVDAEFAAGDALASRCACAREDAAVALTRRSSAPARVERARRRLAREIERTAGDDVGEAGRLRRRGAARASRTDRGSLRATAAARATGSTIRSLCVWLITTARRVSPTSMMRDHLADELPLRPDVHERVRAHREAEGAARERQRRVAVAADAARSPAR